MSAWDDSQWIDYDAQILNVFAGGESSWLEYRYTIGYVGWRRLLGDTPDDVSHVFQAAVAAKQAGWSVRVRVTNASGPGGTAEITAIQTV
jgi:hypothetical protein